MNFSLPAALWALPLALAPLLLHLLSRRRARRVDFSDLTLLRRVQAQALPRTRLRQWLLAGARCAIIFCLVLVCAGPVLEARRGGPSGEPVEAGEGMDLVLLLDCSYSMGVVEQGRSRWAAAVDGAQELLRSLRPSDRVACAAFSDRIEGSDGRLSWMAPRSCQELLARSAPGWRTTDYGVALKAAYGLLSGSRRQRAVLLLSDCAAHGLRGAPPPPEPGVALFGLVWPAAPFNATALAAGPARESCARQPALSLSLWASADAPSALDLWRDRARLASRAVVLKAAQPNAVLMPLPPPARPQDRPAWWGSLQLRPDALAADDAFYYSFEHPRRPRLLIVYGNPAFRKAPQAGYFLQELLNESPARLVDWAADFVDVERLSAADAARALADYDAAILADFRSISGQAAAALDAFVRGGGGLWILPGGRSSPDSFAPLAPWLPVRIVAAGDGAAVRGVRILPPRAPFESWQGFDLEKVVSAPGLGLRPRPGAVVRMESGSGEPLLVLGTHGQGRVAVWSAPLDAAGGNVPVKPVFAALVPGVLALLRQPVRPVDNFAVKAGESIVRAWPANEAAPARVRVRSPEGRIADLWVKNRRAEYGLTERPGLYAMEDDNGGRRVYAVNLDRSTGESDLAPAASPPWQGLNAEKLREEFWRKARGRDMRAAALGLAAVLLILELALALPRAFLVLLLVAGFCVPARAQQGDRFVWTQLQLGSSWDPYPEASAEILQLLGTVTSVLINPERRVVTLKDPALFSSPLVVLAGREAPEPLDAEEIQRLRAYLAAGGMLWIEDISGLAAGSFDRWVRRTLKDVNPDSELTALEGDHVIFRTFFLLRGAAGRIMVRGTLEGVSWAGRVAVVYSRNDLLGAWVKDVLGRPLWPCVPGGEAQRHNARKLTLNLLMYSLTGSYKSDAVHQPYLLQKMRSGVP